MERCSNKLLLNGRIHKRRDGNLLQTCELREDRHELREHLIGQAYVDSPCFVIATALHKFEKLILSLNPVVRDLRSMEAATHVLMCMTADLGDPDSEFGDVWG